jgi:hypothetical protein
LEQQLLLRRDFTYSMRMVRSAMDDLIKISGWSGLRDDNWVAAGATCMPSRRTW